MSIFGGYGGVRGYKSSSDRGDLSEYAKRSYVDTAIQGISAPDLSNYLKKTEKMEGDLDMAGHRLMNLGEPKSKTDAISAQVVREAFEGNIIETNGRTPMKAHLDLGGHRIQNLELPRGSTDAANKYYVDVRIGQVKPIITIIAEERGNLVGGEFEWSFGSNSDGRNHGKVGYVMMAKGKILRMSLSSASHNGLSESQVTVGITVNRVEKPGFEIVKIPSHYSATRTFKPPLELEKGDIINFQTRDTARSSAGVVALLVELDM
jgi:hypothetical protein